MSIGMVNVEIKVGCFVKGVLPIRIENGQGFMDQFRAEVLEIRKAPQGSSNAGITFYKVDLAPAGKKAVWVPEYRVFSFTFGGIEIQFSKFDHQRIDAENNQILKKAGFRI
jgi:hypothetical protein